MIVSNLDKVKRVRLFLSFGEFDFLTMKRSHANFLTNFAISLSVWINGWSPKDSGNI